MAAIIKLKDLNLGDCWVYVKGNDKRPAVTTGADDPSPSDLPDGWDDYGLDPECEYFKNNADRDVELIEHYRVSPYPRPLQLKRKDLEPGDCFQYLDHDKIEHGTNVSDPHIVDGPGVSLAHMPRNWLVSTSTSARRRADSPVRRIPRWEAPFVANPPSPVVLPCVDPNKELRDTIWVLEMKTVGDIKGAECLRRFEMAQQTESLARTRADMDRMVSTNAACALTQDQVEHARHLWELKLKLGVLVKKQEDAERERLRVVVDYVDE